mmetsp:Transcript_1516/g.3545  ORF Transcript_1516/g.3545 Transcript_1516/m.3545 type:complete len:137 (-) Transcript_1516:42-452(-)
MPIESCHSFGLNGRHWKWVGILRVPKWLAAEGRTVHSETHHAGQAPGGGAGHGTGRSGHRHRRDGRGAAHGSSSSCELSRAHKAARPYHGMKWLQVQQSTHLHGLEDGPFHFDRVVLRRVEKALSGSSKNKANATA